MQQIKFTATYVFDRGYQNLYINLLVKFEFAGV